MTKDLLIILIFSATLLSAIAIGLCLLFKPKSFYSLLNRSVRTEAWSTRQEDWPRERTTKHRWAGLAVILMFVLILFGPTLQQAFRNAAQVKGLRQSNPVPHSFKPGAFVLWLILFGSGVGFASRPRAMLKRVSGGSTATSSGSNLTAVRLFGILLAAIAVTFIIQELLRLSP